MTFSNVHVVAFDSCLPYEFWSFDIHTDLRHPYFLSAVVSCYAFVSDEEAASHDDLQVRAYESRSREKG